MAELQVIDEIVEELHKIRGVDLPKICLKMIVLSYMMYCANTFDFKYKNEDGQEIRLNSGCIILCQKGSGKSRTLRALKQILYVWTRSVSHVITGLCLCIVNF